MPSIRKGPISGPPEALFEPKAIPSGSSTLWISLALYSLLSAKFVSNRQTFPAPKSDSVPTTWRSSSLACSLA